MNKKNLLIGLFILLILFSLLFYSLDMIEKSAIFSVGDKRFSSSQLEDFKRIYMAVNKIDSFYSTSAAFELIKNEIILHLAAKANVDTSATSFDSYAKLLSSDKVISPLIESLESSFGEKMTYEHFVKPLIAQNLLADKISDDKSIIQKDRYSLVLSVSKRWDFKECDKELLSEFSEYFIQRIDSAESVPDSLDSKVIYEDNLYYYLAVKENDVFRGYRIRKVSFDEFALKYTGFFKLKFYDKSYERAFILLSENTLWDSLTVIE
ncbi:MAG: hypothetical protein PHW02_09055 [bacterium]|nr:hypothetical protein [bacterium]